MLGPPERARQPADLRAVERLPVVFLAAVFVDAARFAGAAFVAAVDRVAVFVAVDLAVDLVAVFDAVLEAALAVDFAAVLAADLAGVALLVAAFAGVAFVAVAFAVAFFAALLAGVAFLAAAFFVVPAVAVAVPAEARAAADAVFESFFCPETISLKFVPALNLGIRVFLILTV